MRPSPAMHAVHGALPSALDLVDAVRPPRRRSPAVPCASLRYGGRALSAREGSVPPAARPVVSTPNAIIDGDGRAGAGP